METETGERNGDIFILIKKMKNVPPFPFIDYGANRVAIKGSRHLFCVFSWPGGYAAVGSGHQGRYSSMNSR